MEGSYPKPSISVSPGGVIPMGGNVIIRCRHQRLGLRFHLYKAGDGNYLTYTDPAGSEAEFPLTSVRWEHGGSYTCRYTYRAGGVAYSEPSDPVQIIVAGEGPIPASRLQAPHPAGPLGASASPRPSREDTQAEMGEEGDRGAAAWCLGAGSPARRVGILGEGSSGIWERISAQGPLDLPVARGDSRLPRPSISLSPTGVTAPRADVTIRCQGQRRDVRFFLHKAGDLNLQRHMDPAGDGAEFRIPTVDRQHGGSYSCSYRLQSEPFISSQPSDPMQLVVAGEGPHGMLRASLSPGPAMKVLCRGQRRGVRFVLNKERRHFPPVDTDGFGAEFSSTNVRREDGGSYSCSYHSRSEPFAVSYPSDPVELVVRGEGPGSVSPFPDPFPARPSQGLGANGPVSVGLGAQVAGSGFWVRGTLGSWRESLPGGPGSACAWGRPGKHRRLGLEGTSVSSPTPCSKQDQPHLNHPSQGFVKPGLKNLYGWRFHHLPR
uniref:Immunoglobulin domain-containing protein n=1 Tax=Terrapene triunguis TaxID=2587831 RepID=A0A674JZT6_9SAUR